MKNSRCCRARRTLLSASLLAVVFVSNSGDPAIAQGPGGCSGGRSNASALQGIPSYNNTMQPLASMYGQQQNYLQQAAYQQQLALMQQQAMYQQQRFLALQQQHQAEVEEQMEKQKARKEAKLAKAAAKREKALAAKQKAKAKEESLYVGLTKTNGL